MKQFNEFTALSLSTHWSGNKMRATLGPGSMFLLLVLLSLPGLRPVHATEFLDGELREDDLLRDSSLDQLSTVVEGSKPVAVTPVAPGQGSPSLIKGVDLITRKQSQQAMSLLGQSVAPASFSTLSWSPQDLFEGIPVPTPVLVANGAFQGPRLCLTGAIHGDEINSVETIRRVMHDLQPAKLSGTVIGIPIVNQMGFRRSSRYLPDRRDLNRFFPGNPRGSSASRIAYSLFQEVIQHCDALVDFHTGSFHRTNIPQLRANLGDAAVAELTHRFGGMVVLHSEGLAGTLRRESVNIGIPAVTVEAGESMRIQEKAVEEGYKQIKTLLTNLGMIKTPFFWRSTHPVYLASQWLRAEKGGIFIASHEPGDTVEAGETLGYITDPITNKQHSVEAEFSGKIIGMAINQVVMPGYAIFHIGIDASAESPDTLADHSIAGTLADLQRETEEAEGE